MGDRRGIAVSPYWRPGMVRKRMFEVVANMREAGFHVPDDHFYEAVAETVEEEVLNRISEAIALCRTAKPEDTIDHLKYALRMIDGCCDDLFLATELAESPLESILAAHLLYNGNDGYNELQFCVMWEGRFEPEFGTQWTMQHGFAEVRPDFLFKACVKGQRRFLAVECDGHNFHERSPEQALRDRSRDRKLLTGGVQVLRFTGREIHRDPAACLEEISTALTRLLEELGAITGLMRHRKRPLEDGAAGVSSPV